MFAIKKHTVSIPFFKTTYFIVDGRMPENFSIDRAACLLKVYFNASSILFLIVSTSPMPSTHLNANPRLCAAASV